jgi:uncharacterized damage-inducible protein DinB
MGKIEIVQHLYEYNEYANGRLLDFAANLTSEELQAEPGSGASFGSLLATLGHIAAGQEGWLERWTEGQNRRSVLEATVNSLDDVRASLDQSHAGLRELVRTLTEQRLDEDLVYRDSAGVEYKRRLWHVMVHLVNHGTYHRGEAAMALTALGHSPGDLDFSLWISDRA